MASEPEGATQRSRGTVKWFNASKGFGFITPEGGGDDLFVHQSTIEAEGFRSLKEGEEVEFLIQPGDEGRFRAIEVTGPNRAPPQGAPRRTGPRAGFPAPGPGFPGYAMPYPLGPGTAAGRGGAQVPFMHPMGLGPGPGPVMGLPHHHQPPLQQQQSGGGSAPPAASTGPPQQQQEPQRAQQQHQPPQSSAAGESSAAGVQQPSTAQQQQQQQQPVRQQPPAPASLAPDALPEQTSAALRAEPEPGEAGPSSYQQPQQPQQHQHLQHMHHQPHVPQQPQPPNQHQAQLHAHQAAAAAAAAAAAEAHQQQHVAMAQRAAELGGLAQFAPFPYAYGGYPAFWPTPYAIPYGPRGPGRGMPPRAAFLYHPAPLQFMGHQRPPPGTPGISSGVQVVVHNLPWSTTWQELKDAFAETGPIERADVILDAAGRSRGFGTVRYATKEAAESSALKMNNQKIGGRTITVRIDRFA